MNFYYNSLPDSAKRNIPVVIYIKKRHSGLILSKYKTLIKPTFIKHFLSGSTKILMIKDSPSETSPKIFLLKLIFMKALSTVLAR